MNFLSQSIKNNHFLSRSARSWTMQSIKIHLIHFYSFLGRIRIRNVGSCKLSFLSKYKDRKIAYNR